MSHSLIPDHARAVPRQHVAWSLRTLVALSFGAVSLAVIAGISLTAERTATRSLQQTIGEGLSELAYQIADRLSQDLLHRMREMQGIAGLAVIRNFSGDTAEHRAVLEVLQRNYPQYAWIGITDASGRVAASTGGMLEGADVSGRPWFAKGLSGPFLGDVHDALLLEKLLPKQSTPWRFVDVAVPILDTRGAIAGVLGAHLSWGWAGEVARAVFLPNVARRPVDIMIVSKDRTVLLGPPDLRGGKLQLSLFDNAPDDRTSGHDLVAWPGDGRFVTGYSRLPGERIFEDIGWWVLVREHPEAAYQAIKDLQWHMLSAGLLVALLASLLGWFAAGRLAQPLSAISTAAERIRLGERSTDIPDISSYGEVRSLAQTLQALISDLTAKEAELQSMNRDLEVRVQQRTGELQRSNVQLQQEIERRQQVEQERERLIAQLRDLADTDPLTGAYNRRALFFRGGLELDRARRFNHPLCAVMLDIDHFKSVNDVHGHACGDQVIRLVAEACRAHLRTVDILARYGGEEIAVVLVETGVDEAVLVAERIRARIAELRPDSAAGTLRITASLGIAELAPRDADLQALIVRADAALYAAKRNGRNRVEVSATAG